MIEFQEAIDNLQKASSNFQQKCQMETQKLKKKNAELERQIELLQKALSDVQISNTELKNKNKLLEEENRLLKSHQDELKDKLEKKDQEIQKFSSIKKTLKSIINDDHSDSLLEHPENNNQHKNNHKYKSGHSPNSNDKNNHNHHHKRSYNNNINNVNDNVNNVNDNVNDNDYQDSFSTYNPITNSFSYKIQDSKKLNSSLYKAPFDQNKSNSSPYSHSVLQPSQECIDFIHRAQKELDNQTFLLMIDQIEKYNQKSQTRYETISHIQKLLCPYHQSLFYDFRSVIAE